MIELRHGKLHLHNDGILQFDCNEHTFTIEDINELIEKKQVLEQDKKSILLVIPHPFANIEKEAREYMATGVCEQHFKAKAFVLRSLPQRILANFYIKINRPTVPTRFFSNKVEAISWLKSYTTVTSH